MREKILITGADGFIGKNLCHDDELIRKYEILKFCRNDDLNFLEKLLKKSLFVIHLAGENKADSEIQFKKNNFQLTRSLCKILLEKKINIPIIFSSTIHVNKNTFYGKSKKLAENELKKLSLKNGNPILIMRLPGIFGKWSKPNYNSVVSTFCFNIANKKKSEIVDPKKLINLLYIDDLILNIKKNINKSFHGLRIKEFKTLYKISINNLYNKIQNFYNARNGCLPLNISKGLDKKLYATFLTYLPNKNMEYNLKSKDNRGIFCGVYKEKLEDKFHYLQLSPNKKLDISIIQKLKNFL